MNDISLLSKDLQIDRLLERLATTQDPDDIEDAESELWSLWSESGSEAVDFMLDSATLALKDGEFDTAIALMNGVVEFAPDFSEGWNRRATIFIVLQKYRAALKDLHQSLDLEPRHFGALWSLSMVHEAVGEAQEALKVLYQAKDLNPHIEGVEERLDYLKNLTIGSPQED